MISKTLIALIFCLGATANPAVAQLASDQMFSHPLTARIGNDLTTIYPIDREATMIETIMIPVNDNGSGTTELSANVFYPKEAGPVPVIASLTAYDKDIGPSRYVHTARGNINREIGLNLGDMNISDVAPFEAADPGYFVPHGYAVVIIDAPGTGKSPGTEDPFGEATVDAFKQAIEWIARGAENGGPGWSNSKIATQGTSYLGIIQWLVAATQPEGLDAMIVWQGSSDIIRDDLFNGGIQETAFIPYWLSGKSAAFQDPDTKPEFGLTFSEIPLDLVPDLTEFEIPPILDVENIAVPALVAGTWSTQGLHTRGSFEGYRRLGIAGVPRYLTTHGREEWSVSNQDESRDKQRVFLDCFLKDVTEACETLETAPVHIEVMHGDNLYHDRYVDAWPVPDTEYRRFYLDAATMTLGDNEPLSPAITQYDSDVVVIDDPETTNPRLTFSHTFEEPTEIAGYPKLHLIASPDVLMDPRARDGDPNSAVDMDVFVGLRKRGTDGDVRYFINLLASDSLFSRGWIRASLRKTLDTYNGHPVPDYRTIYALDEVQHLTPGEAYYLEIEILPTAVHFEAGETLELIIAGSNVSFTPHNQHTELVNVGVHTVYTGGSHPREFPNSSPYLELPIVKFASTPQPIAKGEPLPILREVE